MAIKEASTFLKYFFVFKYQYSIYIDISHLQPNSKKENQKQSFIFLEQTFRLQII
jgi:hypothetical protein